MLRKNVILGFIKKEFVQMFRDIRMRIVLFAPPLIMMLVFGYAINTDVKNIRVIVLDEDRSSESRKIIERFSSSGYFYVVRYITESSEADGYFDRSEADVYIHIGVGFEKKIKNSKGSEIQVIVDGTDSSRSSMILASVNSILQDISREYLREKLTLSIIKSQFRIPPPLPKGIEIKERILFNPDLSSRNFYLPAMLGLVISMITVVLTSMSIVKERETGTIDQIIVSPIKPLEFIIGKTIPYVLIGFADTFLISLLIILWFNVPFNGSFVFLLLVSFAFLLSTTAVGLYISAVSTTQQQALLSVFLYFMPAMMFSGFVFPVDAMPEVVQWVTLINPMRYYIEIIRGIFLKGIGINILWVQFLVLSSIGIFLFYLSARRFARHLE